jgi:triosephosphate isomerase (TIM)
MASSHSHLQYLVAGNWKMNGLIAQLGEAHRVRDRLGAKDFARAVDVMICPPATLIAELARQAAGTRLLVGAQDCHAAPKGAHTGDLSGEMIKDAGGTAVIVGHSERRAEHSERNSDVKAKATAAHRAGLTAIVCVGETEGERRAGLTLSVVERQLAGSLPAGARADNTVIAYEPVWAIGTGLTAKPTDVAEVHASLRGVLQQRLPGEGKRVRILYGGSVKPDNARELMAIEHVNGALVGGASLVAADFLAIVAACEA